jgi:hypothetical protein
MNSVPKCNELYIHQFPDISRSSVSTLQTTEIIFGMKLSQSQNRQVAQQPLSHLMADFACAVGWLVARIAGETKAMEVFRSVRRRANEGIHACMVSE